jgi:hypothetical protein
MADVTGSADAFINATLRALKPGKVFSSPGGKLLREYQTDSIVGEVFSWVSRSGVVWWQLKEGGFVEHAVGKFDPKLADITSQATKDRMLDNAINQNELFAFLDSIPLVISRVGKLLLCGVLLFLGWQILWPLFRSYFRPRFSR